MKKAAKSYITFTRTEQIGILSLCALLLVLIAIRTTMVYWVHPPDNNAQQQKLQTAWEVYKRSQPAPHKEDTTNTSEYADKYDENETPLPNIININTADSATLVRLKGIGPAMAHKIIVYRQEHGAFREVDELLELQSIPAATFAPLKKHLSVQ